MQADIETRNALVLENIGLAHFFALKFLKNKQDSRYNDLVQVGAIGLMQAVQSFDPEKGAFGKYASWYVKTAIRRYVRAERSVVCRPVNGSAPPRDASLDGPAYEAEPSGETALDRLEAPGQPADAQLAEHERDAMIREALARLSAAEQDLLIRKSAGQTLPVMAQELAIAPTCLQARMCVAVRHLEVVLRPSADDLGWTTR